MKENEHIWTNHQLGSGWSAVQCTECGLLLLERGSAKVTVYPSGRAARGDWVHEKQCKKAHLWNYRSPGMDPDRPMLGSCEDCGCIAITRDGDTRYIPPETWQPTPVLPVCEGGDNE